MSLYCLFRDQFDEKSYVPPRLIIFGISFAVKRDYGIAAGKNVSGIISCGM